MNKIVVLLLAAVLSFSTPGRVAADWNYLPNCAGLKDAAPAVGPPPEIRRGGAFTELRLPPGEYLDPPIMDGHGSMMPVMNWGHLLLIRRATWSEIHVDQYIMFAAPQPNLSGLLAGSLVVHQVIGLGEDGAGPFVWTRGVANCYADAWLVRPEHLRGIVVGIWFGG